LHEGILSNTISKVVVESEVDNTSKGGYPKFAVNSPESSSMVEDIKKQEGCNSKT